MTREEAIAEIERLLDCAKKLQGPQTFVDFRPVPALEMALSALRPISREQVILCRDCRFWQDNNGGYPHPECRWGNDETPGADDYCSFAERK